MVAISQIYFLKNVIGTVQKYLPSDGADEALFHIIHDDGDKKFLDVHKQYRKSFSPHNLNSVFALHFESQVVTINRLVRLSRPSLLELSQNLNMEVEDGII